MNRTLTLPVVAALASALAAQSNTVVGLNGRITNIDTLDYQGRRGAAFPNGQAGMAMLNEMCNPGTVNIPWQAPMQPNHPKFGFLITRLSAGGGRMEQISDYSYCKHAFLSVNSNGPCGTCQNPGTGALMGVNCADAYGSFNNADRDYLGPPSELNPWLGTWNPVGSYFDVGDPSQAGYPLPADGVRSLNAASFDAVKNRITVNESDLLTTGATYFYGIQLMHQGEALANRGDNNASRGFTPSWNGSAWSFPNSAAAFQHGSILQQWTGATVNNAANGTDDGRFFVASKVTPIAGGMYHYEYAVHNADNHRGGAAFRVPLAAGAVVQNAGFRDIDNDATNNWAFAASATEIAFTAVGTNALNWNSIYNCWFDCSIPPGAGSMTIDEARPGSGALTVQVTTSAPSGLNFATKAAVGTACGTCTGTFYQLFPTSSAFDLAGRSMTMTLNNGAYTVAETPVAFVPAAGTNLGLGLGGQALVNLPFALPYPGGSTTQLRVASSGYVSPSVLGSVQVAPNLTQFLQGVPRWAAGWALLNPTASSAANIWLDANPNRVILTWNGVPMLTGTAPNTFQIHFLPNGTVHVVWQAMAASSFAALVGWTPGGGLADPGNRDLSVTLATPQALCAVPFDGLTLDASALPVLGTTVQWQIGRIPASTGWGALMKSLTQAVPAIDLTSFGMPGCFAHAAAPVAELFLSPGTSLQVPQALPNSVALMGVTLVGQAVTYNPTLSPLGLVASNAMVLSLGF